MACRLCASRAGAFCSTVTVASWSCSVCNSIIDSRVGFGLRVVMVASLFVPLRPDVEMLSAWQAGYVTGLMSSYPVRPST